jgi:hypothetical protein
VRRKVDDNCCLKEIFLCNLIMGENTEQIYEKRKRKREEIYL